MRYYCPNCRQDFWDVDFKECPKCGYHIKDFEKKDYVDKLINALGHHAGEVQHWVIMILAQRKEKRAIPYLEKLQRESKDPSLVKVAKEAISKISAKN
jgi:Zn ribbon nucleic-acid-binding protein